MNRIKAIYSLFVPLMLIACSFIQNAKAQSNFGSMLVSTEKNSTSVVESKILLEEALAYLESEYRVTFFYKDKVLQNKYITLKQALSVKKSGQELFPLLDGLELEYARIDEETYVISSKKEEKPEFPIQETISGTITDSNSGESLPGVNILVKGTTTGTSTDSEGTFELTVESLQDTLVVSFIGYQTREVPIDGRTTIDVVLQAQAISGEEMVVTALGLEQQEKSLTYSTEQINTEQLTEARELNILNSLQGKVAGLSINTVGSGVGSDTRVILRGNRSISGDSQPLYVVDGVPIRGTISEMSPNNIASVNVLKGPSASALYGSEAQDGAIVVETKKGRAGEVNISLNTNFQVGIPDLVEFQNEYAQGFGGNYDNVAVESWGPKMEGQMVEHWSLNPNDPEQYALTPQPDNTSDVLQNSTKLANSIDVSLGNERLQGAVHFTRSDAEGIMPKNKLQRHNFQLRITSQPADWVSIDGKLNYMQQELENPIATGQNPDANTYQAIYTMPRNIQTEHMSSFRNENDLLINNHWAPGSNTSRNPYWMINRILIDENKERVQGLLSLTFHLTDKLSLLARSSYSGENTKSEDRRYYGTDVHYPFGYFGVSSGNAAEWNNDVLLSYNQSFFQYFNIDANIGASIKSTDNYTLSANVDNDVGLTVPNFFELNNTSIRRYNFEPGAPQEKQAIYAFGKIGWKEMIYLDITARNDWSSTLPASNRSYFYPSVGVSAILSDLIKLPELFSYAQLRASWAKVGSSAPAQLLSRTATFSPGGNNGHLVLSNTLPNKDLKPEETESYEIGLDLRFLQNRLGFDLTAYKTNTFNQLFTIVLPPGSGASQFFTNGGDIENKGIEVKLTTKPVQNRNIRWNSNVIFDTNHSWVNEISDERPRVIIGSDIFIRDKVIAQGEEFGNIYSVGWQRDDQNKVIVGDNGLPKVTNGRTVKVANFNPDWNMSFSNSFNYNSFSLSFLIEHRQGGSFVSMTDAGMYGRGNAKGTVKGRNGGLIFGQNLFSEETAVLEDGTPNDISVDAETFWRTFGGRLAGSGEAFVEETTNTRLRELTLGYNLPQSVLNALSLSNIKVSLVGRNLLFFYKAGRWDPDFIQSQDASATGLQSFAPPTTRTFGFNITVDL